MPKNQLALPGFPIGQKAQAKRRTHYEWDTGSPPPVLGLHSMTKHAVQREYLVRYVDILTPRPEQEELKLTLVDGFAGGGAYLHPKSGARIAGSPLIMVESMAAAEVTANSTRRKDFSLDVEYVFVEKHPPTVDYLRGELADSELAHRHRDRIQLLPGCFSQHLSSIIERVEQRGRSRRVIFMLDQYGYSDVRMSDLRTIFRRLPNAEVILTVAIDWLIDHWTEKANYDQILANLGVDLSPAFVAQVKQESLKDWRPVIQASLHTELWRKSGADYYTPFFIHSVDSHRAYWLLHFSGHSKARDAMMQLHWEMKNHFQHFGRPGFGMLGFDPRRELGRQQTLPFDFDDSARALTQNALMDEIPRLITHEGMLFEDFFNAVVNNTPATKEMLATYIGELTKENELEVCASDGRLRRRGARLRDDDVVRRPQQTLLLPRGQ